MNQAEVKRKQIQLYSYAACILLLLYFGKSLQNSGLTYFVTGMVIVMFFMQFCSGGVADVMGRMLRYRRKRGLYMNVCAVRRRLNLVICTFGILSFILVFCLADVFANKMFMSASFALIIRILSPIILIRMLDSLLLGHFQSFGSHIQTAISCLLRPILYFFLGKGLTGKNLDYGKKVSVLLRNEDFQGMYGAAGLASGIVISELIILILMLVFYFISDRNNDKRKSKEGLQRLEGWSETMSIFAKLCAFGIGIAVLGYLMILFIFAILKDKFLLGIYCGEYLTVCAIPVLLVCTAYYLLYAKTIYAVKGQNARHIRDIIQVGIKYAWSFGILAGVLLAVLAPQISVTFFDRNELVEEVFQKGSLLIPFFLLWIYFVTVNVAHNKYGYALLSALVNTILFGILSKLMQGKMESELLAVVAAGIITMIIGAVLLGVITSNVCRLQTEYIYTYLLPLACAGVMGLILMAISKLMTPHIGNEVCFYVCICIGILLYLFFLGMCRVFSERDMNQFCGKFGRKCLSVFFK